MAHGQEVHRLADDAALIGVGHGQLCPGHGGGPDQLQRGPGLQPEAAVHLLHVAQHHAVCIGVGLHQVPGLEIVVVDAVQLHLFGVEPVFGQPVQDRGHVVGVDQV